MIMACVKLLRREGEFECHWLPFLWPSASTSSWGCRQKRPIDSRREKSAYLAALRCRQCLTLGGRLSAGSAPSSKVEKQLKAASGGLSKRVRSSSITPSSTKDVAATQDHVARYARAGAPSYRSAMKSNTSKVTSGNLRSTKSPGAFAEHRDKW